jgi:hypothetical protein
MKNQDYVDNLPIGEVVRFGQVLSAMKKRGLIEDYDTTFKYLTGHKDLFGSFEFLGNFFELKYFDGCFMPYIVKCLPPMRWDKKTKKYYPAKRIYYKCFRANFKRKTLGDKISAAVWNLHYKSNGFRNGKFNSNLWHYICDKSNLFKSSVREFKGIYDRRICLWGNII